MVGVPVYRCFCELTPASSRTAPLHHEEDEIVLRFMGYMQQKHPAVPARSYLHYGSSHYKEDGGVIRSVAFYLLCNSSTSCAHCLRIPGACYLFTQLGNWVIELDFPLSCLWLVPHPPKKLQDPPSKKCSPIPCSLGSQSRTSNTPDGWLVPSHPCLI